MNDRLNRAVVRLLLDDRLLRRFRRDPEAALKQFGLTQEEQEAVKDGGARRLLGLGLDPKYVRPKPPATSVRLWMLARAKRLSPAMLLAALALPAAPAVASRRRRAEPSPVARVTRYFARRGYAGEFHVRVARAGSAGRITSRAARGSDPSAFYAAARRAARDVGIQPPPGSETP